MKNPFKKKLTYAQRLHAVTNELSVLAENYVCGDYSDAESFAIDISYLRGASEHLLKRNNEVLSIFINYAEQSKNLTPKSFDIDPFNEYG